ncbi:MAG: TSUP family transporter [Deltaproteobacteria bacterium]|nr:TSUP family transporter [Deltaproteobacteria bacterium]
MHYLTICLCAFLASGLTLFSGFGLGTLLLPVMALFFPLGTAIALTAVVHCLNNLFKLALLGRYADKGTVLRFGLPAVLAALLGAEALLWLSHLPPLFAYELLGRHLKVTPVKLVVAGLMVIFALLELLPRFAEISVGKKYLPLGGLLSGFFGGLSGHQGALRAPFLLKSGLSKESFIATGVVISLLVDIPRIVVYAVKMPFLRGGGNLPLLAVTVLAAFAGAFLGRRLLKKVTLRGIQILVAVMLLGISVGLAMGII